MRYSSGQYLLVFLCLIIIINDTSALRLRIPSLRITSTFKRAADYIKKKTRFVSTPRNESEQFPENDEDL